MLKRFIYIFVILFTIMSIGRVTVFAQMASADTAVSVSEDGKAEDSADSPDSKSSETQPRTDKETSDFGESAADKKAEEQIDQPVDDGKKILTYLDAEAGKEETLRIEEGEKVNILPSVGKYNGVAGNNVIFLKEDKKISDAAAPEGKTFIGWKAEKTQGDYAYTLTAQYKDASGAAKKEAESKPSGNSDEQDESVQNTSENTLFDKYPAFAGSKTIGDTTVMVTAESGVFPAGSSLYVAQVSKEDREKTLKAVGDIRKDDAANIRSRTFDIKILDAEGNEIQPISGKKVNVTFDTKDVADEEHVTRIYHTEDDTFVTRELQVKTQGTAATAETSGFSYYTVEFTYNEKQYVLEGDDVVKLSDILSHVGISGEVSSWEVSAPQLFNIFMGDEEGIDYTYDDETEIPANKEGGTIPYMAALQPFKTNEWLKVTVDGVEYTIDVTDNWNGTTYVPIDTGVDSKVIQGGNENNFTADMPLATIWVDDNVLDTDMWKETAGTTLSYNVLTSNNAFRVDDGTLKVAGSTTEKQIWKGGGSADANTATTAWGQCYLEIPVLSPAPAKGADIYLDGPVIEYKIKNAAQIFDAETNSYKDLDIVITYSNLHVVLQSGISSVSDLGRIQLFDFNKIFTSVFAAEGKTVTTGKSDRVGMQVDVNVKVLDKSNNLVNGSFYLPMVDVDVERITNRNFDDLGGTTNSANYDNYSEAVALLNNYGAPNEQGNWEEKIWIPGGDFNNTQAADQQTNMPYLPNIYNTSKDSTNPLKITSARASGYGNITYTKENDQDTGRDNDFYTGFATLANNTAGGVNLRMWGTGIPNGGVLSFILGGSERINYKVAASTDVGGDIATTTAGNMAGDLTGGDIIASEGINAPKISAAAPGQAIKYTMTPKPGYKIKNVYVATDKHTVLDDVQNPGVTVQPIDLSTDPNVSYSGSGVYVYSFSDINSDKSIHVEWESTKLKVTKAIESTGWEVGDTFTFNIRIWNPETHNDKFRVRAYKQQVTSAYNFTVYDKYAISGDNEEYYVTITENGNTYFIGWDTTTNTFVRQILNPGESVAASNFDAGNSYKWKLSADNYLYNVGAGEYIRAYKTGYEDSNNPMVGGTGSLLNVRQSFLQYKADSDRKLYIFVPENNAIAYNLSFYKASVSNTTANIYYDIEANPSSYSLNGSYTAIIGEAGTYKIELTPGQTPDVTALENAGYTVEVSKIASEVYDMETALKSFGATLVPGTTDTYSFTLTNGASIDFDAVIPAGWSYEITEIGENDSDLGTAPPGTKPGWQFVSKTANAAVGNFDGDESVTFTNKRLPKEIKVTKIWDDEDDAYETRPSDYVNTLNFNVKTQETQGTSNVERTYNSINDAVSKTETPSASGRVEYVFHTRWDEKITDITETVPTGYDVSYNIPADGESGEITNSLKYFDITINKTAVDSSVDSNPADGMFTYKIKVYRETSQGREYRDLSEYPNYLTYAEDDAYELTISTEGGNGTGEVLRIPYGFKYEITENERFGWRLLNVDGDSDKTSATGQAFADATHTFTNKKLKFCLIKEWDDYSNSYDTRPDDLDVNVNLIGDNTDFDIDTIPWDKDTYEQENLWVKEFELPEVTESNSYNTFMGASAYEEEVPYGYTDTIREDDFEYNPDTDTYEAKLKNTVNDRIKLKKSWVDRSDMFSIRPADLSTTITNVEDQLIYNRDWSWDGDYWTKTIVTNNPKGTYTSYTASEAAPVFYDRTDTGGGVMTFNADTGYYEYTFENTLKTKDLTITKNTENNAAGTFKIKLKVIMPETRTRTIHYLDDYGNKLAPDTVQVVTFLPTDASTYTVSGSWSEVIAPSEIDGRYTYDTTSFPAKDMTGSTPTAVTNEERYVYYTYTPSTSINVGLAYRVYSGGTWGGVVAKPQTITVSGGSLTESKTLTFTPGAAAQEVELPGAGTYTISMAGITKEDLKPEADLLALQDSPMPLIIDTVSTTVTVDASGNCTVGRTICTSFAFGADWDNNFIYNDIEELKNAYGGTGADTKLNVLNPHSSNAGASASGKTVTLTTVISQGWDDSTGIAVT